MVYRSRTNYTVCSNLVYMPSVLTLKCPEVLINTAIIFFTVQKFLAVAGSMKAGGPMTCSSFVIDNRSLSPARELLAPSSFCLTPLTWTPTAAWLEVRAKDYQGMNIDVVEVLTSCGLGYTGSQYEFPS